MRVNDTVRVTQLSRRDFIAEKAFKALRRANARGVVSGVLGQRDLRYLVIHEGETSPAVYLSDELEPEPNAYWRVQYSRWGLCYFVEVKTYLEAEELRFDIIEDGGTATTIEGPFYSDKALTEGLLPPRSLFDHLKETD